MIEDRKLDPEAKLEYKYLTLQIDEIVTPLEWFSINLLSKIVRTKNNPYQIYISILKVCVFPTYKRNK